MGVIDFTEKNFWTKEISIVCNSHLVALWECNLHFFPMSLLELIRCHQENIYWAIGFLSVLTRKTSQNNSSYFRERPLTGKITLRVCVLTNSILSRDLLVN